MEYSKRLLEVSNKILQKSRKAPMLQEEGKKKIFVPNHASTAHLAEMIEGLKKNGAPTVRAIWQGDHYRALEGSHRVAAAKVLGLPVIIEELQPTDKMLGHDIAALPEDATAGEVSAFLYNPHPTAFEMPVKIRRIDES